MEKGRVVGRLCYFTPRGSFFGFVSFTLYLFLVFVLCTNEHNDFTVLCTNLNGCDVVPGSELCTQEELSQVLN